MHAWYSDAGNISWADNNGAYSGAYSILVCDHSDGRDLYSQSLY